MPLSKIMWWGHSDITYHTQKYVYNIMKSHLNVIMYISKLLELMHINFKTPCEDN